MTKDVPRPCLDCGRNLGQECLAVNDWLRNCPFRDPNYVRVARHFEAAANYLDGRGHNYTAATFRTLARRVRERGQARAAYQDLTKGA